MKRRATNEPLCVYIIIAFTARKGTFHAWFICVKQKPRRKHVKADLRPTSLAPSYLATTPHSTPDDGAYYTYSSLTARIPLGSGGYKCEIPLE